MSTATLASSGMPAKHARPARGGRPPFRTIQLLLQAVRDGLHVSSRYEALRRQGLSHVDAINRAIATVD